MAANKKQTTSTGSTSVIPAKKKSSSVETGIAKNAATFDKLTTSVNSYGELYVPSAPEIAYTALVTKNTAIKPCMTAVRDADAPHKNAVNARQEAFKPMSKTVTRMENALKGCGSTKKEIADGASLSKKIKGERIEPKHALDAFIDSTHNNIAPVDTTSTTDETHNELVKHSVSQMGFDNRIENFKRFVTFLSSIPKYKPNEADLKITALTAYVETLEPLNVAANTTFITLYNARVKRDKELYAEGTGAHDLLQQTKYYVLSAFGSKSPEYKLISKLEIKVPKKKK